ncbi:hypothetical protein GOP47_0014223 [Adiantum capillus-veneris]|uniref:non-specific serine/threonine protein kinase n=1 Tax=Adiantum capillus-veneris TaxID=13818 RepID=A0A9D4UQI2_ADICA|nr:hypothetical protein GOP47_0014223 [Adiantum capillus-veneris]
MGTQRVRLSINTQPLCILSMLSACTLCLICSPMQSAHPQHQQYSMHLQLDRHANRRLLDEHANTGDQARDMEALLRFKAQLTQGSAGALSTWKDQGPVSSTYEADPCSWYGITCTTSKRVVQLELQNAGLEGDVVLASLLEPLDQLKLLDLSGNQLHFVEDVTIGTSCASLETLILANNVIEGVVPTNLFRACGSTIQVVDLSHNSLTGSLPHTIFTDGCGSLQLLDLSYNRLTGNVPSAIISQCPSLQELHLSSNSFSGQLPPDLLTNCDGYVQAGAGGCAHHVQVLDLSFNNFSGPIYDSIFRQCAGMISVDLSSNAFTGEVPVSLDKCSSLEYLNLSNNRIGNGMPASLGSLDSIKVLDLSNNSFTGSILQEIGNACPTLVHLDLSVNNLSGTIPSSFSSCNSLRYLNLASNKLSGRFPAEVVTRFRSLESLLLTFNAFTGPLPAMAITTLNNLKVLDLGSNKLSGPIPSQLCFNPFSALEKLMLPNNGFVGEIPAALANCSKLKALDLSFNHLQGEIPPEVGCLSNLESLSMWYNEFTGQIPKEIGLLSKLRVLILNNNFLSGLLPDELSNCTEMQWLLLSNNQLTGSIPAFIGSMQQLTMLEMGNNSLSGPIPSEIANASKFLWVDLNSNFLSGHIPPGIGRHVNGRVDRLHGQVFAFIRNQGSGCRGLGTLLEFAGITPEALSPTALMNSCNSSRLYAGDLLNDDPDLSSIQVLDLSYNRLEGSIPQDIGYLTALMMLSLGHNLLEGAIPASFMHLRTIGVLDLSYNKLEGGLWPLANCSFLVQIDVSNNNFSGPIPSTGQLSIAPSAGFEHNPGLCGEPLPPCGNVSEDNKTTSERCISGGAGGVCINHNHFTVLPWANSIVMGILIALALMCMLTVWGIVLRAKKRQKDTDELLSNLHLASCHGNSNWNIGGEREPLSINVATFERPLKKLTFAQLIEATNGFSLDSLIGIGGFGEVYKAELKDGSTVAIKKLLQFSYQGDREFTAEMETLGKIKHRNLVPLLGYCKVGEERLLVYEYMEGGSLDDRLHGDHEGMKQKLTWQNRKQIACGAARGLCFLHHEWPPHIIHRDIKSSNVLLDKNLEARVSDFGMARLISALDTHLSVSTLAGTPGYVPPEYYQSFRCTFKGDIYSFGVILLELLTGKRPTDKEFFEDTNLVGWVRQLVNERRWSEALDPWLLQADHRDNQCEMLQFLQIACDCVQDIPSKRPTMRQVVSMLKGVTSS